MTAPASAPKTIEQLQEAFRLATRADAEALADAGPVADAFRTYANRCLSSGTVSRQLPDWKDVDGYLTNRRMSPQVRRRATATTTLEAVVEADCFDAPYDLVRHASLFALRVAAFLRSDAGEKYDVLIERSRIRRSEDLSFDRCRRIVALLGFCVNRSRERVRALNQRRDREMRAAGFI
ncbi:hypothetical protein GGR52DRAFT_53326 [Hypoxylon sp. FL1284]|nr:hypothetical protein GGR52DRAFT_53326 [Hypoxylon sp. FL1284]